MVKEKKIDIAKKSFATSRLTFLSSKYWNTTQTSDLGKWLL